jgi:uncharacterized alkaline shock family protein YloU
MSFAQVVIFPGCDIIETESEEGIAMTETEDIGKIKISDEVVVVIVKSAVLAVDGVVMLAGGFVEGFTELVGRKHPGRGIKVDIVENEAAIDIFLIVEFGYRIPEIATKIQFQVKRDVQAMTGLTVTAVNNHVQGISFTHDQKDVKDAKDVKDVKESQKEASGET